MSNETTKSLDSETVLLYEELSQLVREAEQSLEKAKAFADQHNLVFEFSPAYGMGGTYYGGKGHPHESQGWYPSSGSC